MQSSKMMLGRLAVAVAAAVFIILGATPSNAQPVQRKGVTLAGDINYFISNNFANLQAVLNTGAGTVGVNLPWFAATQTCAGCGSTEPSNPTSWNDPVYAASPAVAQLDKISSYIRQHGNGVTLMVITFGTPSWAACSGDPTDPAQQPYYPPQDAADYGDFMYAMSERYNGQHTNSSGEQLGFVRDWVVYNEVNSPSWWHNTSCNTSNLDPVSYYGGIMNQAYTNVHHVSNTRVLAGAFTSYDRVNYQGAAGLRISTSYADWRDNTNNGNSQAAWISPLDFVQEMHDLAINFDAIALHPYPPRIYDNPLMTPPAGAVSLANLDSLLELLRDLYPSDTDRWHVALTEYFQHSYYGNQSGYDRVSAVGCPNYFCAQTSEANLNTYLQTAYGPNGSHKPYVDYLMWGMWQNVYPYVGGLVRADGSDKNEAIPNSGNVRASFSAITP